VQYVGGKKTIARWVRDVVAAQRGDSGTYIEPFVGGGSVYAAVAPSFPRAGFGDLHPDLIALWAAVAEGWLPPENISEDDYRTVRAGPVCALRGFVGFGCSFGGKWFGGYARAPKTPERNYAAQCRRWIVKHRAFEHGSSTCYRWCCA
jgi:DNA adenine methylase